VLAYVEKHANGGQDAGRKHALGSNATCRAAEGLAEVPEPVMYCY
jgi:hypothetical protein